MTKNCYFLAVLFLVLAVSSLVSSRAVLPNDITLYSVPLPVNYWIPPTDTKITGQLTSCLTPVKEPYNKIAVCDTSQMGTYEQVLTKANQYNYAAVLWVAPPNTRPGMGYKRTLKSTLYTPSAYVQELSNVEFTSYNINSLLDTNVTAELTFSEGNYCFNLETNPFYILFGGIYALFVFGAIVLGAHRIWIRLIYTSFAWSRVLLSLLLELVANLIRFVNAINLTNMHNLYSEGVDRAFYTSHLPISLGTSLLLAATFADTHSGVKALSMTQKRSKLVMIGVAVLLILELISTIGAFTIVKIFKLTWWSYPTTFFYIIADISIGLYFAYVIRNLQIYLRKINSGDGTPTLVARSLTRIYKASWPISIGSFGWLLMLIGVFIISFSPIKDGTSYIVAQRTISLLGFYFVQLTSYGVNMAFPNPVDYELQANRAYTHAGLTVLVSDKTLATQTAVSSKSSPKDGNNESTAPNETATTRSHVTEDLFVSGSSSEV